MNIGTLTQAVNTQAEENMSNTQIIGFGNDAIAKINIECLANFPYLDSTGLEYTAFPDKWQRALFIPFVVGRVKQVDSSQFEYSDAFNEFAANLALFKSRYTIPDQYVDPNDSRRFDDDFSTNPWGWGSNYPGSGPLGV